MVLNTKDTKSTKAFLVLFVFSVLFVLKNKVCAIGQWELGIGNISTIPHYRRRFSWKTPGLLASYRYNVDVANKRGEYDKE